jgi:hypothetical protein
MSQVKFDPAVVATLEETTSFSSSLLRVMREDCNCCKECHMKLLLPKVTSHTSMDHLTPWTTDVGFLQLVFCAHVQLGHAIATRLALISKGALTMFCLLREQQR